jgi:hypothetical protein
MKCETPRIVLRTPNMTANRAGCKALAFVWGCFLVISTGAYEADEKETVRASAGGLVRFRSSVIRDGRSVDSADGSGITPERRLCAMKSWADLWL